MSDDVHAYRIKSTDRRLGRHVRHDPRSKDYRLPLPGKPEWRTKSVRIYDPVPNPNQSIGDCTGCAQAMLFNARGNRLPGKILTLSDADAIYGRATHLDSFTGGWPPDDTGSDGLAACKASKALGFGGAYWWIFDGADGVVDAIMAGHAVAVGTKWYEGMFTQNSRGQIEPTGAMAGGHEYVYRGYDASTDELVGRCWWGDFRDFRIKREHANDLLMDDGDAHVQERVRATAQNA